MLEEVLGESAANGFTVFLGRFAWQGPEEKALVKLLPQQLPTTDPPAGGSGSVSLLHLLKWMGLQLQLESGAEYGYYVGKVSPLKLCVVGAPLAFNVEVIAPASARQITRARVEERFLVRETAALYAKALGPLAEEIRKDGRSIQWVYNILDHKKEVERIVFEDTDPETGFMLVPDPKWKAHPDPATTPKAEWHGHPAVQQLACLVIVHDRTLGSLRDLRKKHLPLLKNALAKGLQAIHDTYGVGSESVRVFVHYMPQFFHFHIHFSRVGLAHGIEVERAHLLQDIIDKIEGMPAGREYYEEAAISYTVKKSEDVYQRLAKAGVGF